MKPRSDPAPFIPDEGEGGVEGPGLAAASGADM